MIGAGKIRRPMVWATFFTICGIMMRLSVSAMVCLVSFLSVILIMSYFVIKRRWRYLLFFCFVIYGFCLGSFSAGQQESLPQLSGKAEGEGIILDVGRTASGNRKLVIRCDLQDEQGKHIEEQKIYGLLSGENPIEEIAVGERIRFSGEMAEFYAPAYPGGYDEALHWATEGVYEKLYLEDVERIGKEDSLSTRMAGYRSAFRTSLRQIFPAKESGILQAMLTGEREDIPQEIYDTYRKAGVIHVLCISGLHMSVLAVYLSFFLERLLGCGRRTSALVTIGAVAAFLLFIESSPSSLRAGIMISIVMLGRLCFHLSDRKNTLAIAAFLLLSMQPLYLFHAGFQLSFLTVLGICIALEQTEKQGRKQGGWRETLRISIYASLFSYPLVAYHFSAISLAGLLANLILLPMSGLLLGFGLFSGICGLVSVQAGIFAAGSAYMILQLFEGICRAVLQLPFAYLTVGRPGITVILLYYGLLLLFCKGMGEKGSWKAGLLLCSLLFCSYFQNPLFFQENRLVFLDVGQGDAAVLSTWEGKHYLIDGGGAYGKSLGENTGKRVLLPYLEQLGIRKLDGIFLSHPDYDHMIGLLEVCEEIPTEGFYLSAYPFAETEETALLKETLVKYQVPLYTVKAGDTDDGFTCLYPLPGVSFPDGEENHGSMVLRYEYGGRRILFTGDIGAEDERLLLTQGIDASADILKVAHHGSKYSSQEEFLQAVSPQIAILSCGKGNLYGHPHPETVKRLEAVGAEMYRTDQEGAVLIHLGRDGKIQIETTAERNPFYERFIERFKKTMESP